jgi:hypothetical protein
MHMGRKFLIGLPIMAAILAMGAGVALSKHADKTATATDMSGWWSLDASKSDSPPAMGGPGGWEGRRGRHGGGGGFGGHHGGGGWGGRPTGGEGGDGEDSQRRGRPVRLPERFRIQQDTGTLTIADSTGAPVEEIAIGRKVEEPPEGMGAANAVPTFAGTWNQGQLEIVRNGSRGTMKQSFALEEDGKDLVIRTTVAARDSRPSREFKRVYRRTST